MLVLTIVLLLGLANAVENKEQFPGISLSWSYDTGKSELSMVFESTAPEKQELNIEYLIVENSVSSKAIASKTTAGKSPQSETVSLAKKNYMLLFTDLDSMRQHSVKLELAGMEEHTLPECWALGGTICPEDKLCKREVASSSKGVCCIGSCTPRVSSNPIEQETLNIDFAPILMIVVVLAAAVACFLWWKRHREGKGEEEYAENEGESYE